jgi:hypothetical protein
MTRPASVLYLFMACIICCCSGKNERVVAITGNPAAEGFDIENSDPAAVELADSVMSAMGGRANWDKTRFLSWESNNRKFFWDKNTGNVRIEEPSESVIYLMNSGTDDGKIQKNGKEVSDDSLTIMLSHAKNIWAEESYLLIMPFKLKDSGVTLMYLGEDTLSNGTKCNVLELTIKKSGDAHETKSRVFVDLKDNLVKQWARYEDAEQDSASEVVSFDNYKRYGDILLSTDRSDGRGPKNVKVDEGLPDSIFEKFNP